MDQKTARLGLRALILINAFLFLIALAISLADESLLPKELAAWKEAQEADDASAIIGLVFALPLIAALVASLAGMFMFKKWGAWLNLGVSLAGSLFMLIEPNVESGLSAFFSDLNSVLSGVILGVAFFSSALEPDRAP